MDCREFWNEHVRLHASNEVLLLFLITNENYIVRFLDKISPRRFNFRTRKEIRRLKSRVFVARIMLEWSSCSQMISVVSPIANLQYFFIRRCIAVTSIALRRWRRSDWYPRIILARALKIRKKIHAVLDMKYEMWRSSSIPLSCRLSRGFQL